MTSLGVVAIGRNEGSRLERCLRSVIERAARVVYVDSGSTDGSVDIARSLGVEVVELERNVPFTAARARNAGFKRLMELVPELDFVQFVDGDCEVVAEWLPSAVQSLLDDPRLAVVAGRRRERHPEASVYNRLCDWEWDTPVGEAKACGGDALMRVAPFREVGGYDASLIAGEEPELCVRLRAAGWHIRRLNVDMTWHDAAMTRFAQWWRRTMRAGHAYAEGAARHGQPPERHWVRESNSIWFWGGVLPLMGLLALVPTYGVSLVVLALGYALLAWRIRRHALSRGLSRSAAWIYAGFTVLGKFPQVFGQMQYHLRRALGLSARLIEYKGGG